MFIQTQLIQHITSLPNLITIAVELGAIYLYFKESVFKLNQEVKYLKEKLIHLENLSIKIVALESKIELINKDMNYLVADFVKLNTQLTKIAEDSQTTKLDINKIKGSMLSLESYFKQIIENETKR